MCNSRNMKFWADDSMIKRENIAAINALLHMYMNSEGVYCLRYKYKLIVITMPTTHAVSLLRIYKSKLIPSL